MDARVERGITLLKTFESEQLSLAQLVDKIECVSQDPVVIRQVLDKAEVQGLIDRGDAVVEVKPRGRVSSESHIVQKQGDFTCRRCGCGISTGHFIKMDEVEIGAFGSSCIDKVTGLD